jgi:hypothetical protein
MAASEAPDGSALYFIVNQPGPFLSSITEDLYDIVRASGFNEAKAQLTCFAQWAVTKVGGTPDQWMANVGNAMLALVKPKMAKVTSSAMMTSARAAAPQAMPMVMPTSEVTTWAGLSKNTWYWIAGGALLLGVGVVVLKKKHVL